MRLADYYEAKGEAPGRWVGSGLVGIDGIEYGDVVTAEQMKNLFGDGCHPVTGAALGRKFGKGSVAGFDLTFSPAKSVSTLWAIAPPEVASRSGRPTTRPFRRADVPGGPCDLHPRGQPAAPARSRPAG